MDEKKWLTIDNHKVRSHDIKKSNEQGTIFILKRRASKGDQLSPNNSVSQCERNLQELNSTNVYNKQEIHDSKTTLYNQSDEHTYINRPVNEKENQHRNEKSGEYLRIETPGAKIATRYHASREPGNGNKYSAETMGGTKPPNTGRGPETELTQVHRTNNENTSKRDQYKNPHKHELERPNRSNTLEANVYRKP